MGRSKENRNKRKRSSGSKDSGCYAKRHAYSANYRVNSPSDDKISQSTSDSSLQSCYDLITYAQVPYHGWLTYFYNQEYDEKSSTVAKIEAFVQFFVNNPPATYNVRIGLNLDINLCINDSNLRIKWPSFVEDIKNYPSHTLNCINAGFFEVMMRRAIREDPGNVEQVFRTLRLNRTNLINYESANPLTSVRLSSHGKLISISGIVVSMGRTKLSRDSVVFVCKCKRQIIAKSRNETTSVPKKCNVCGNNSGIKRLLDSPYESTRVSQNISIKDYRVAEQIIDDGAISPNIISVRLTKSLVDKYMTGDKIRIVGIPRVILGAATSGSNPLYVDANSVFKDDDIWCKKTRINWSVIERIKSEPDILRLLVHSLCPSVQGHEIIKAALVLGLFAGTYKCNEIRDYIHVLMIGNLGLGKSQLLRACAQVAPEGTYIRGNSTISLGSKMTVLRENTTEDNRLEAGALALANGGLLCLDELDKMSNQHQTIYNAMSRQRIDTFNSDLRHYLPFRTAIFAMTNSKNKRYDPSKTVLENVNASHTLLGCFDVIFLMRDNPDVYLDKLMCDRVLDEHTKRARLTQQTQTSGRTTIDDQPRINVDRTLSESLTTPNDLHRSSDLLPEKLFRMYINYARLFVKPKISEASALIIERFCSLLSQKERENCERYMQNLVTLTEARAKIDSREETSERDAFDAIEILEHSMSIDTKDLTQSRSSGDSSKLTANKVKQFLEDLKIEAFKLKKNVFTVKELRNIAGQENTTGNTLSVLLSKLNDQGYLLKISSNSYKAIFR